MDTMSISEIASSGMNYERTRVQYASSKLAMANMAYSSLTDAAKAASKLSQGHFASLLQGSGAEPSQHKINIKPVQDPEHPRASSEGTVYYLDIDPVHEMATLVSALRSYEANVRAYNANSDMNRSALSIGGKQ